MDHSSLGEEADKPLLVAAGLLPAERKTATNRSVKTTIKKWGFRYDVAFIFTLLLLRRKILTAPGIPFKKEKSKDHTRGCAEKVFPQIPERDLGKLN